MVRATAVILSFLLFTSPQTLSKGVFHVPNTTIQKPVQRESVAPPAEPKRNIITANVSAYTASSDECGKQDGVTASGKVARAGRTIAMDNVPFGTKVKINGQIYIVEDRFGGNYSNRIDIFMNSKEEAFRFGRQYLEVEILEA